MEMGNGDGNCKSCARILETLEHIFFNCRLAQWGWASIAIYFELVPTSSFLTIMHSLIDTTLDKNPWEMARLYIIHQTCWTLWNHRNKWQYNAQSLRFLPKVIINRAREHLQATTRYHDSKKKQRRMRHVEEHILHSNKQLQDPYSRAKWMTTVVQTRPPKA